MYRTHMLILGIVYMVVQVLYLARRATVFHLYLLQQREPTEAFETSRTRPHAAGTTPAMPHHAIIVPYRDRQDHLDAFLIRMDDYFKRNFPNDSFSLYIIEQADAGPFSRGFLLNAGLSILMKEQPATNCVILHDVDLLPKYDGVPYNTCTLPIRLGNELQNFAYSVPYPRYVGGIVGMHLHDWQLINGMSNDYQGWGGEDDDLFFRMKQNRLLRGDEGDMMAVPPPKKGAFDNIDTSTTRHVDVKRNHSDFALNREMLDVMMKHASPRWKHDGLTDVGFKIKGERSMVTNGGFTEARVFSVVSQIPASDIKPILGEVHVPPIIKKGVQQEDPWKEIEYARPRLNLPDIQSWESVEAIVNPVIKAAVKQRRECLKHIRKRHEDVFTTLLTGNQKSNEILLVDAPYHSNVGDSMLTEAEILFSERSLKRKTLECYTNQGKLRKPKPAPVCNSTIYDHYSKQHGTTYALWAGGGNWGDIYRVPHVSRVHSFRPLLENNFTVVSMPQSLHFNDSVKKETDAKVIRSNIMNGLGIKSPAEQAALTSKQTKMIKSRVIFTWRSLNSYNEALRLYPMVENKLVPDIAFQLGPYAPNPPKIDILIFLRSDVESILGEFRDHTTVRELLIDVQTDLVGTDGPPISFEIVDWTDRKRLLNVPLSTFDKGVTQFMSYGKVVIADRLHAAILTYLTGVPIVYLDQSYGKLNKTLDVAFDSWEGCRDYETSMIAQAKSFEDALRKAIHFLGVY